VHACTDITGFGLLGHACEMVEGTDTGMVIRYSRVPVFGGAVKYLRMGLIPAGTYRNEKYRLPLMDVDAGVGDEQLKILFDPQTSGGLLIALGGDEAEALLEKLLSSGVAGASIIGEITRENPGRITVLE